MVSRSARARGTRNRLYIIAIFLRSLFRLKRVFTQVSREQRKASIYRSPYALPKRALLRDLRQRRVEEVVDGDHAVALVERVQ